MRARRVAAGRLSRLPAVPSTLATLAMLLFLGCGPDAKTCPFETPVCPDPQPSYTGEVSAIIQTFCVGCHGPGGQESIRPFATYANISMNNYAGPMQRQLLGCLMPPADAPQPTAEQKQTLVGWLTCGAPNN